MSVPDDAADLAVAPVLERLALTLPADAAAEPLDFPGWDDLAARVCRLIDEGRAAELAHFFSALEDAYDSPLDDASSNALREGLMESLIYNIDAVPLPTVSVYRHLLPTSRSVWEELWAYLRRAKWLWPDV